MSPFSNFEHLTDSPDHNFNPEGNWIVTINNGIINSSDFHDRRTSIELTELEKVVIITTDTGPYTIDLWWRLSGNNKFVYVPVGSIGEEELLHNLQKLDGFDNGKFIKAMCSVDNAEHVVWNKN